MILNISGRAGKFFMTLLPTYQISLLWGLDWWQGKDKQRFGLVGPARAENAGADKHDDAADPAVHCRAPTARGTLITSPGWMRLGLVINGFAATRR